MTTVNAMLEYAESQGVAGIPMEACEPIVDDSRCRWLTEDERDEFIFAAILLPGESWRSFSTLDVV